MSSDDNGQNGNGGQGGQSGGQGQPAGGQPQGGQPPQQPQGGQPAGQPAGGQPPQQPQGGYGGGQAGYSESVGDIFSKDTTLDQIKAAVVFYALAGVGTGIAGFMFINQYTSGGPGAQFGGGLLIPTAFVLGPILAVPVGLRIVDELAATEQENLVYATAGVATLIGNVVLVLLFRILISLEVSGDIQFGELLISTIVGGIGAAIVAVGAGYWTFNQMRR